MPSAQTQHIWCPVSWAGSRPVRQYTDSLPSVVRPYGTTLGYGVRRNCTPVQRSSERYGLFMRTSRPLLTWRSHQRRCVAHYMMGQASFAPFYPRVRIHSGRRAFPSVPRASKSSCSFSMILLMSGSRAVHLTTTLLMATSRWTGSECSSTELRHAVF